jgi:hypothetical protein
MPRRYYLALGYCNRSPSSFIFAGNLVGLAGFLRWKLRREVDDVLFCRGLHGPERKWEASEQLTVPATSLTVALLEEMIEEDDIEGRIFTARLTRIDVEALNGPDACSCIKTIHLIVSSKGENDDLIDMISPLRHD